MLNSFINNLRLIKYKFRFINKKKNYKLPKSSEELLEKNLVYLKNLRDNGFVVIKDYYSAELCDLIKDQIDNIFLLKNKKTTGESRLFNSEFYSYEIMVFKKDNFLSTLGSLYFNTKIKTLTTLANRLIYNSRNELGSGGDWHRDNYNTEIKAMIYLTDVGEENGPLQIVRNSHSFFAMLKSNFNFKNKFPNTRFDNKTIQCYINKNNIISNSITGKKGTLVIFDSSSLHRGTPLKKGFRYALTNYYYPDYLISLYENKYI